MFGFCYLEMDQLEKYANDLVSILYDNMEKIVPTGHNREFVFQTWFRINREKLQNAERNTVIVLQEESGEVAGFCQYSIHENVLLMEEIQIKDSFQGKYHIFRNLYGFLLEHLGTEIEYVEAYVNKKNEKSMGVHSKLGLSIVGENQSGTCYHFRGTWSDVLNWYHGKVGSGE